MRKRTLTIDGVDQCQCKNATRKYCHRGYFICSMFFFSVSMRSQPIHTIFSLEFFFYCFFFFIELTHEPAQLSTGIFHMKMCNDSAPHSRIRLFRLNWNPAQCECTSSTHNSHKSPTNRKLFTCGNGYRSFHIKSFAMDWSLFGCERLWCAMPVVEGEICLKMGRRPVLAFTIATSNRKRPLLI